MGGGLLLSPLHVNPLLNGVVDRAFEDFSVLSPGKDGSISGKGPSDAFTFLTRVRPSTGLFIKGVPSESMRFNLYEHGK